MNNLAKNSVRELFETKFNRELFAQFIADLLKNADFSKQFPILRGEYIKAPFRTTVLEYSRICQYTYTEGVNEKIIDVLIVKLSSSKKLESARTAQRNFVVDYLNGGRGGKFRDAALVAFYADDSPDWRFSLVKIEYLLEQVDGKVRERRVMSSARRYSFLVGANENSHTAQSQLLPILEDDNSAPKLETLEQAFGVETVTKEFFEKYKELFLQVKEALDGILEHDSRVKADFLEKEIDTVDFAKKLLGQIVFLYFLQKKGWFGVSEGCEWGNGDKKYLRSIFNRAKAEGANFFNDYLEPLFYEALAKERDNNFYSRFNCKIPFLNGGLFDPIGGYNWTETNIDLPNELFSNNYVSKDRYKDVGTGIFDIFDRYNFTVREDEPLEKEVAIDPEMLGKVFENMLEVKDRKSKGTYYTPREIVHYICQESLINYLESNLEGVPRQDIEYLIKKSEFGREYDEVAETGVKKYQSKLPSSVRENAVKIDLMLANIKVCDPAVGSGAFLVGMMNEIVKARSSLTGVLKDSRKSSGDRTEYEFKSHAIAESLHGVDADPGAVEITKLRLWLSLIVDEDDIANIKPLPNLDYKIMQGDSLVEEYDGIKLFDESFIVRENKLEEEEQKLKIKQHKLQEEFFKLHGNLENTTELIRVKAELSSIKKQLDRVRKEKEKHAVAPMLLALRNEAYSKAKQLKSAQQKFFSSCSKSEKQRLKEEIEQLTWELIEITLKENGKLDSLAEIAKFKRSQVKPFFLWKLNFADVFTDNGGFDVVIGNPPYVQLQKLHGKGYKEANFKVYDSSGDLYCLFYEKGLSISKKNTGLLGFITSNKWMRAGYGEILREYFSSYNPLVLVDLGPGVFETATVDTNILIIRNRSVKEHSLRAVKITKEDKRGIAQAVGSKGVTLHSLSSDSWFIGSPLEISLKAKLERLGKPLKEWDVKINYGIKTGLNEAFIIDTATKEELCSKNPKSAEIIKPILRGRDIQRYSYTWQGLWIIATFPSLKLNIDDYPAVRDFLINFGKDKLAQEGKTLADGSKSRKKTSNKWFETQDQIAYYKEFEKEKVVWGNISYDSSFCYVNRGIYVNAPANLITCQSQNISLKFLIGCLNSKIFNWEFKQIGIFLGNAYEWKKQYIEKIHLPLFADSESIYAVESLVSKILAITFAPNYNPKSPPPEQKELEREIDRLVYQLYDLTEEEIKIVEGV